MRGESMKGKSKKSTYSTTFGVDPILYTLIRISFRNKTNETFARKTKASVVLNPQLLGLRLQKLKIKL